VEQRAYHGVPVDVLARVEAAAVSVDRADGGAARAVDGERRVVFVGERAQRHESKLFAHPASVRAGHADILAEKAAVLARLGHG